MRTLLAVMAILVALPVRIASADAVYRSRHIALHPVGTAPLTTGFVENIHANGPIVYAHEVYVVVGASPSTSYDVTIAVYVEDPDCSPRRCRSSPRPSRPTLRGAAGRMCSSHRKTRTDSEARPTERSGRSPCRDRPCIRPPAARSCSIRRSVAEAVRPKDPTRIQQGSPALAASTRRLDAGSVPAR